MKDLNKIKSEGAGKKIWRLLYPGLMYLVICYLIQLIYACLYAVTQMGEVISQGNDGFSEFYNTLIQELTLKATLLQSVGALICIPILLYFLRGDNEREALLGKKRIYEKVSNYFFLLIPILGICTCLGGNNLILASGIYKASDTYSELEEAFYQGQYLIEIIGLGIIIPICEELIFRGVLYKRLRETYNIPLTTVLLSLMFAFYHGNLVQGIYAFFLSLLMIYVMERYHTLAAPVLFHISANLISVIASETGFLDNTYATGKSFWISTIIYLLVIIATVIVMEYYVISRDITPETEEESADNKIE